MAIGVDYATNLQGEYHLYHVRVARNSQVKIEESEEHQVAKHYKKRNQMAFAGAGGE